jgi:hypothetical protein
MMSCSTNSGDHKSVCGGIGGSGGSAVRVGCDRTQYLIVYRWQKNAAIDEK